MGQGNEAPMPDETHAARVTDHYTPDDLPDAFRRVLRGWGKEDRPLTPDDLAPIDQFHVGGQAATVALARLAGVTAADRVLDVGGGFGGPARSISQAAGCAVTVLDLTAAYCAVGESLTARCGLAGRVGFTHGDALAAPFPDASFDLAWTQHSSMNIADKRGLYAEIARLLRPGGRLALYEIMAGPAQQPPHYPVPWARDPSISFLRPPAAIRALLTDLGVREISWEDLTPTIAATPAPPAAAPPPGLHLVLGDDFLERGRNMLRNLIEGRTSLIRAVLTRP
jgi:SAM-dependent methyltransferase